jgi:hypothetical protein
MTSAALLSSKIPAESPQLASAGAKSRPSGKTSQHRDSQRVSGSARSATRGDAPALEDYGPALIAHYLSPGRHPADRPWSRKHADTQARLCARYLAPVIAALRCEDIKTADMQAAVNAAPTAGEGARVARAISALVTAGLDAGYLVSPRLKNVRWQPGDRPAPPPRTPRRTDPHFRRRLDRLARHRRRGCDPRRRQAPPFRSVLARTASRCCTAPRVKGALRSAYEAVTGSR